MCNFQNYLDKKKKHLKKKGKGEVARSKNSCMTSEKEGAVVKSIYKRTQILE